ncbi:MAG TPA: carbon monoxide dehydrogenase, partial [Spirochaetota bacterium]|nr:carbon monoxide dehydrogenase [Spirochaetota bacterium]
RRDETLVMDMEAGIEHLGRATVRGVTALVVVVEPGMRSVETVKRIVAMAAEIGLARIAVVVNKVRSDDDERYLRESLPGLDIAASFPFSDRLLASDRDGVAVIDGMDDGMRARIEALVDFLEGKYS